MDLPAIALELIDRFINARSFADSPLPSEQSFLTDPEPVEMASATAAAAAPLTTSSGSSNIAGGFVVTMLLFAGAVGAVWRYNGSAAAAR